jgi:hypothetical protein
MDAHPGCYCEQVAVIALDLKPKRGAPRVVE